ncbi:MAG: hypothetical protein NUV57_00955 [archaeon]|nr:hypothetical protein [archaeon]
MQSKMKGFVSAWVAVGAIAVLFLASSASLNLVKTQDSLLIMDATRELNIKTDNIVRVLDKATSKVFSEDLSIPNCDQTLNQTDLETEFTLVLSEFKEKTRIDCSVTGIITNTSSKRADIRGNLECFVNAGGNRITETRLLKFYKEAEVVAGPPSTCRVIDRVSGLQENP